MRCYIVDDEDYAVSILKRHIAKVPQLQFVGANNNPISAISEIINLNNIDLVFLDIEMPELSGLHLAEMLPKGIDKIITTAHSNYAASAFDLNAIDFLTKPISLQRFIQAISKIETFRAAVKEKKNDQIEFLFINPGVRGKIVQVALKDILYIEGLKNYVVVHTDNAKYMTYLTMSEIEEALSPPRFIRIHKSFVVNREKINSIEGNRVFVKSFELSIGIKYKEEFRKFIAGVTLKSKRY